jgi:hypothetical protein
LVQVAATPLYRRFGALDYLGDKVLWQRPVDRFETLKITAHATALLNSVSEITFDFPGGDCSIVAAVERNAGELKSRR